MAVEKSISWYTNSLYTLFILNKCIFTAADLDGKKLKWQKISSPPPCLVSVLSKHKIAFKSSFLQTMQLFAFLGRPKNLSPREKEIKSLFQEGTK